MKKLLLSISLALWTFAVVKSQCVYTCSNYAVVSTQFSVFPSGTTNLTPTFTNTFLSSAQDDGDSGPIPIGFGFEFYCNEYHNVYICSNGFIQFDHQPLPWPSQYVHPTQSMPDATVPNGIIAFNMTDLDPSVGGTITYTTVGVTPNRMFIVTYSNVPCFGQSDLNTGQIVLHETSNIIEIHTAKSKACTNQSLGSTQGIENITGSAAFTPPGRNANSSWPNSADNTAYIFMPYSAAPLGAITGNTLLCEGGVGSYVVPTANGSLGYNWTASAGFTGSSTLTTINYTATASGVVSVTASYTCGLSPASTLAVNVLPAPVVAISSVTPAIMCSGKTVTVNVSGAATYTLEPGTNIGPGPFTDIPMAPIVYTVTGTDANGCNSLNSHTASVLVLETPTVSANSGSVCQGQQFVIMPSGADSYSYVNTPFSTVTNTIVGIHNYTVIGTDLSNGCKSEAVSTLSVIALPPTSVSADRIEMCRYETATLTAQGAVTYNWKNTTSTASTLTISPLFTAVHTVTGTSAEGCVQTASVLVTVSACTGLSENSAANFRIYPNPTTGALQVESSYAERILIFDILGRNVKTEMMREGLNRLNLDLPAGKYFIRGEKSGLHHSFVISRE